MNLSSERIAFVLPNLSGGGAARVATILTREWADLGHEVHLFTFEPIGAAPVYPVDERIVRHQIGLTRSPRNVAGRALNNIQRVNRLGTELKAINPTIIISFLLDANVATVLAGRPLPSPVLISERNHPGQDKINPLKAWIRSVVYPLADRLCVQTHDIRQWYLDQLALDAAVIPNPAPVRTKRAQVPTIEPKSGQRYQAVGLGRLEPQKGYDRLVKAFALLKDQVPDWDLTIFGEGSERAKLEALVAQFGLANRIKLPGATEHPESELERADLFIHPSHYEGFPNALVEALSSCLCVVATDCPGATSELLHGGAFGALAPNTGSDALASVLVSVMADHKARCAYAAKAHQALVPLKPRAIAERWLDMAQTSGSRPVVSG